MRKSMSRFDSLGRIGGVTVAISIGLIALWDRPIEAGLVTALGVAVLIRETRRYLELRKG